MNWLLALMGLWLSLLITAFIFLTWRIYLSSLSSLRSALENSQNALTANQAELLQQQQSLLNRLLSHNWTEFAAISSGTQVLSDLASPTEYVVPDSLYEEGGQEVYVDFSAFLDSLKEDTE